MLDALRKKFFSNTNEEVENMKKEDIVQADLSANTDVAVQLAAAQELLATQAASLAESAGVTATMMSEMKELSAKLEQAQSALAAVEDAKAALAVDAHKAKMDARKARVEASIGTDKSVALMSATEALDDASFDAVVKALAGSVEVEAQSTMFKEVGVSGEVDTSKIEEEGAVMKALKAKYAAK